MKQRPVALNDRQFTLVTASITAAVLSHLAHVPAAIAASIGTIILGAWILRSRRGVIAPVWIRLPLIVLLPLMVILHYGNVFGREPGSAFICGMLALKLLETATRRDARAAACFASFVLMSALLFDTSLVFTLLLVAASVLLLATLGELEPRTPNAPGAPGRHAVLSSLRQGGLALLAATPLALCAFIFFPRLQSPLWRLPSDNVARTGLGDSMTPGSIQDLLVDDSPAFRVVFDGALPPQRKLYWRGPVLAEFDGATWTRQTGNFPRDSGLQSGAALSYEVTMEPTDKPWLFVLDAPLSAPTDSIRAADMTILRRRPVTELFRYRAQSAPDYRLDVALPDDTRRHTLALPAGFDPRSLELARSWRHDLVNDEAVIAKALDLFHSDFTYTMSPPLLGRDSIDDFVFNTKRGFCEHYAAAFVFLMRAAGIPARVVTGYQGGFFSSAGNYLLVRQSDAHAWSEVWLANKGWIRIDPTAAVSPRRVEIGAAAAEGADSRWYQANWIRGVRNQFDLVNRGWNSIVVQFNALRQQNLLAPLGIEKADYMTLIWTLIASSSLFLLVIALWVMRTPRRVVDPLDAVYTRLCAKLAPLGPPRSPTEGPVDYARRTTETTARELLEEYVHLRYACALPTTEALVAFDRAVRRWRPTRV